MDASHIQVSLSLLIWQVYNKAELLQLNFIHLFAWDILLIKKVGIEKN